MVVHSPVLRVVFVGLGWISVALGIIGALLPIVPTTPFMILAAFLFSKGSPRLHDWLVRQPFVGKGILDWEKHGVIRLKAKILSTLVILPLFAYTFLFVDVNLWIKGGVQLVGVAVLAFIWSRPSQPELK